MDNIKAIVIADRGFVWVGTVRRDGDLLYIANCKCIRKWGTTKGLAELFDGPTSDTQLDAECPLLILPIRAVISVMPVDQSKW